MTTQSPGTAQRIGAIVLIAASVGCSSANNSAAPGAHDASPMDSTAPAESEASPGQSEAAPGAPLDGGADLDADGYTIVESDAERTLAADIPVAALDEAVAANNAFAIDLYTAVLADQDAGDASDPDTGNVLTSPLSASLALTMAYGGAADATATQMASVLHANLPDGGSIFGGQNALAQALSTRGASGLAQAAAQAPFGSTAPSAANYRLQVANAVWGEITIPWLPSYLTLLAQNYGTGVYATDFMNHPARADAIINGWVSDETDSLITNLIPAQEITSWTVMVLVNALEVKFPWASPFQPLYSASGTFTRADGTVVSPSFMNQTTSLPYADDGQAQLVELPMYGSEALLVAVPHTGVALADYEADLATSGAPLSQPAGGALVALSIPKVALSGETFSLARTLKGLGMQDAFVAGTANFSGMSSVAITDEFYILDVLQQTALSMDEGGLQAAAATAVIVDEDGSTSFIEASAPTSIPVVANRPYLIAIVDVPTGAILMLGHVEDPTAP